MGLLVLATFLFLFNVIMWCFTTTFHMDKFSMLVEVVTKSEFLGDDVYMLCSVPIVLCTVVATLYLELKHHPSKNSSTRCRRF